MNIPCKELHGKIIHFDNLKKSIPNRNKFLDKTIYKNVQNKLNKQEPVLIITNSTWDDRLFQLREYSKSTYVLVLFGIFEDGRRATVCINDIEVYFEVKVPKDIKKEEIDNFAEKIFNDLNMDGEADMEKYNNVTQSSKKLSSYGTFKIEPTNYEVVKGKPLHYYQIEDSYYVKIYFDKLEHRKCAIEYIRALNYETAHDDLSCYYRVASRDYLLKLADWTMISEYRIESENKYQKGDVIHVSINNITNYTEELSGHLLKDYTMTMCFDIETYNSNDDGEI